MPETPAALSLLRRLHTVCWLGYDKEPRRLPGGPWLSSLRRLALSCHFLSDAASLKTLSTARQLEQLGVADTCQLQGYGHDLHAPREVAFYRDAPVRRIIEWARQHASLQLLALGKVLPRTAARAAAAQRARPGLSIEVGVKDVYEAACGYECQWPWAG